MIKNRFFKTTLGVDAEVFVGKAVEYTAHADYKTFVASAANGELGIFNAKTLALVAGTGAAAAGTEVFIAVKRGSAVEKSTAFKIGSVDLEKIVYAAPVKHAITVTTTAPASLEKGDFAGLVVIETTPGLEPLPRINYGIEAKSGETFTELVTRLVAQINDANAVENQDKTLIVTAAVADTDNIVLTAVRDHEHFTVALRGILVDSSFAVTAQYKQGSGSEAIVRELEKIGDIRKGVTTNYPDQPFTQAEDFGKPDSLVEVGGQYQTVRIKYFSEDRTRTLDKESRLRYVFLVTPSNGAANPTAEVNTILGV